MREQYGTAKHKTSKYMLDENQSLRMNFEGFVETVQVLLQTNVLYIKKENIRTTDHRVVRNADILKPAPGGRASQKTRCRNLSCSSNRKKDNPPLEIPTGSAARVRIT